MDQRELGQSTVEIKSQLDPNVQTLFFSATYTDTIIGFSKALMKKASVIKLRTNTDLLLSNIFQVMQIVESVDITLEMPIIFFYLRSDTDERYSTSRW